MAKIRSVVVDYETASACDLKACGADRYAEDPTTEILCLTAQEIDRPPVLWYPGLPRPPIWDEWIADPAVIFVAHNVRFERAIWRELQVTLFGWPELPASRWHDTMASAAQKTLPQKLERVLPILRIDALKDTEGSKLTISLSKVGRNGFYAPRTPEVLERVYQYNMNDITSQTALHKRLGWLSDNERRVWLLDQKINDRGVKLDLPLVRKMQEVVDKATAPLAARFQDLTGGLRFTQGAKLLTWARDQGVVLPNLQKETVAAILGADVDMVEEEIEELREETQWYGELPAPVREALHIRQLIGSASVKKLARMEQCVGHDGRARGLLQYHGAGPGRWAGRLLQPQNFPRGTIKGEIDQIVDAIMTGDPDYVETLFGPAVETVISALRYTLVAEEGTQFVAGDFASIEARVCLALAGQWDKVSLLASGADVYCDMAAQIYGRPITKADPVERQTGKNSVLGLGFQMGAKKFFARYCADQSLDFAQNVVDAYRKHWAPKVSDLWYGLGRAAIATVHEGTPHESHGVLYEKCDLWLTARLPSGRRLWYFKPEPIYEAMPWDETDIRPGFRYEAQKTNKWTKVKAFGGLLTENVVQGLARDLMVEAAFRAEANDFPIVLTVHDELLTEVPEARADYKALEQIMSERSDWAAALKIPVATEGWQGARYRK